MSSRQRSFETPVVRENGYIPPHAFGIPEHDDFIDGLTLNDLEDYSTPIGEYAKTLSRAGRAAAKLALPPETNVIYLEDYRNERNKPWAA